MAVRLRFPPGIGVMTREAAAIARQAMLLRYDTTPILPTDPGDGDDVVVLLHGLFATAGVLRPMRAAITRHAGVHTATMSYAPGPGVLALAERVGALLRDLPARVRIHLVGHSLGGIVTRYFAQEIGDPRIVQTISLASPFGGVPRARLLCIDSARDIDPSSGLLRKIVLGAANAAHIPHLSIIAMGDTFVRAPIAHALPGFDVAIREDCGHNTLLFDPEAATLVEHRILAARARARAA